MFWESMHGHISYWLICHETRNKEGVNVQCLSVLGLFGFPKVTLRYLSLRIISTKCNDTPIGNNILLLKFDFSNRKFKEPVHEHLALFIYF